MNVNPSHAAGRAAYTRHTNPSQEAAQSSSSREAESSSSAQEEPDDPSAAGEKQGTLTSEERAMIEENFPDDPELSMRLYGRGQDTKTVRPDAVGHNLDVTG